MLTEREAWLQLAAIIEGAPEMLECRHYLSTGESYWDAPQGLCSIVSRMRSEGAVSERTAARMRDRIWLRLRERGPFFPFLASPQDWPSRFVFCLEFAEEAAQ